MTPGTPRGAGPYLHRHQAVVAALLDHDPEVGLIEALILPDWERAEELFRTAPEELDAWHPVGGTALYAAARLGRTGPAR